GNTTCGRAPPRTCARATPVTSGSSTSGSNCRCGWPASSARPSSAAFLDHHAKTSPTFRPVYPRERGKRSAPTIPKVVGGLDPRSLELAAALYGAVVVRVVPVSSPEVAEACKILENTYRAVNLALVNELKVWSTPGWWWTRATPPPA